MVIISLARSFTFFGASLRAGSAMHAAAARCVLHAPLSFFHTNPTGRVLNRFSKSKGIVGEFLPQGLLDCLQSNFAVLGECCCHILLNFSDVHNDGIALPQVLFECLRSIFAVLGENCSNSRHR